MRERGHHLHMDYRQYKLVRYGTKRVEIRPYYDYGYHVGDPLTFHTFSDFGELEIRTVITGLNRVATFRDAVRMYAPQDIATKSMTRTEILRDLKDRYLTENTKNVYIIEFEVLKIS